MTVLSPFRWVASCLVFGLLTALLILVATLNFASLSVEDPENESPDGCSTEFKMVPGDTQSATIVLAQHTEEIVHAGVRLDPLSESAETHETIEIYITGLGSTQTV